MPLCDLCEKIPWEDLPTVPPHLSCNATGHKYIQPVLRWPKDVPGHPHHNGLDLLQKSAAYCDLCSLIYVSAGNVEKNLEELRPKWEAGECHQYDTPTWELFIVKRREGGDGCWVMSFVDGETARATKRKERGVEEAWIIAAIGLCVREGSPLEKVIMGRPVEESAGSATVIGRARKWLQDCDKHTSCKPSETHLPTRILDVGTVGSLTVRLLEPSQGTIGHYVSLSYCWGKSQVFTTTRATIEERKRGIIISDMPSTYQNIIKLTRELGLRYLWVDSLCICQDELADWERESAKMLSIYSNAYLTVAASRAKESSEGFLGTRIDRKFVEMDYTCNGIHGKTLAFSLPLHEELIKQEYVKLYREPLSTRGWALQERVLSHRVLLYGSSQMFFECNKGFRGEDGLFLNDRHDCVHNTSEGKDMDNLRKYYGDLHFNNRPKCSLLNEWYNLLWLYGPKKLSHPSDKLPAISGIASIYAGKIGEEYLAGLWRDQLMEGLVWQSLSFRRVSEYRAPSWSWASGDGIPATGQTVDFEEIGQVLDAKVTLKGTNPFGEVTDGWIKLRAPLEQLHMMLDDWDPGAPGHVPYDNNVKVRTNNGDPEGSRSRFDFHFTAPDAPQEAKKIVKSLEGVKIFALILLKSRPWKEEAADDDGTYHCLIVKKVDVTDNYQRLGFYLADKDTLGRQPEKEAKEQFPLVTLV